MGEGAGIGRRLKNPQLVPIHLALLAFAPQALLTRAS